MESLGYSLYFLGIAGILAGLLWSFFVILEENKFLAVLCLFLPMGFPAVMLMWLPKTWRPLTVWAVGLVLLFSGLALRRAGE